MERSNTYHEEDNEEWESISHLEPKYIKRKDGIITTELQMAGGGKHAWWYVCEWDDWCDPVVYIETLYNTTLTDKTLILRQDVDYGYEWVKLVERDYELPEEDDYFYCPYGVYCDIEDEEEEEEQEEEEQTTKKAGSIDWNAYIYSLQQTIKQNQVVRSRCDDRISELEDIVEELENRLLEAGINYKTHNASVSSS